MIRQIAINILVHERANYLDVTTRPFYNLKRKDLVKVNLLCSGVSQQSIAAVNNLNDNGIQCEEFIFPQPAPDNFMDKIRWVVHQPEEFTIRVDDDCFAPTKTWDALIAATDRITSDVLAVAPCVTNGIPTFDSFAEYFCDGEFKNELYQMCLDHPILEKWGIDFSSLAPAYEREEWDPSLYYQLLYQHGNDRLGLHPMRFTQSIQERLNQIVLENFDEFMNPPAVTGVYTPVAARPYYCNTCFLIKTAKYKEIVYRKDLVRDAFEEIPFNLYRRENNLYLVFLEDSWMLNMYYRAIGNDRLPMELKVINEIRKRLNNA